MRFSFLRGLLSRLVADESGNILPEYAVVLTGLTILSVLAFSSFSRMTTPIVTTNANNFAVNNIVDFSGP